ncbi:hypothetical protein RB653_007645 [Dictyostelium firmibasis]|uniref:Protein kinase domain-containing protein n=1 Tax=Dictyostelium firmibasis TaxID=79012 RepID=A0AAN7YRL5_9MYCE
MIENDYIYNENEWEFINDGYKKKGSFGEIIKARKKNGIINEIKVNDKIIGIKIIKFEDEIKLNEVLNLEKIKKENNKIKLNTIIDYYGYGIKDKNLYIYLEFIEGNTIYELKKNNQLKLDEKQIQIILGKCLETIKFLHKNCKIIHMDLKCDNIILRNFNNLDIVIIDYGLSINVGEKKKDRYGTFLPPEFLLNPRLTFENYNYIFDVYCLGCVSIELFLDIACDSRHGFDNYLKENQNKMSPLFSNFIKKCINTKLDIKALEIHPFINGNYGDVKRYFKLLKETPLKKIREKFNIVDNSILLINDSSPLYNLNENDKKMIVFGESFNNVISKKMLENKKIVIINNPNREIGIDFYIPKEVIYLSIKGKGEFEFENSIPNNLETFIYEGEIRNEISGLKNNIKHLILENYNELFIKIHRIPPSVTFLQLGNSVEKEVIKKSFSFLPPNIEELCFGCTDDTLKEIERKDIPSSINFFYINGKLMKFLDNKLISYQ